MSATIRERDMLKTAVPERGMDVTTALHQERARAFRSPPWTGVWAHQDPQPGCTRLVWLRFWHGALTPGGIAEAHASVVARVVRGEIPAPDEELGARWMEHLRARKEGGA